MHRKPADSLHLDHPGVWIELDKAAYTLLSPVKDKRCGNFLSELSYVLLSLLAGLFLPSSGKEKEQGKSRELRQCRDVIHAHVSRTQHRSRVST